METGRGLLVYVLLRHGYQVYAINPKALNRYKDRHVLSKTKTDKLDALSLAHLLRTDRHRFKPLSLLPEQYRLLDQLCLDLRKLVDARTRLANQITACLKEFYPQALGLFCEIDSPISMAFLKSFPDPETLLATTKRRLASFFKKQNYRTIRIRSVSMSFTTRSRLRLLSRTPSLNEPQSSVSAPC